MKITVINGANINMLGIREPNIYGSQTYAALIEKIENFCAAAGIETEIYQSNHEGDLVDKIQECCDIAKSFPIRHPGYRKYSK